MIERCVWRVYCHTCSWRGSGYPVMGGRISYYLGRHCKHCALANKSLFSSMELQILASSWRARRNLDILVSSAKFCMRRCVTGCFSAKVVVVSN
jgi:hypothetical protein